MEAMFLNAIGNAAAGGAFAPETPSHLIDSDLVFAHVFWAGQLECGC
jgi:hypothetical protein